jgi:adenosylmethionine-8-amino-7-oxononanoate aminotransferase
MATTIGSTSGRTTLEHDALDHIWIHSARWLDLAERDGLRVIARGAGCTIVDIHDRTYLDGLSGLYVVNVGHGRAEIGEAMAQQARELAYVSSASYTNVPAVALADRVADLTPGDLNRIFFCSGGSEAVETAIKIAKQVQVMRGFPRRYRIIARSGGYHGATYGAMSLNSSRNEQTFGPFVPGVSFVPSPNRYRNEFGVDGEAGDVLCAEAVEQEILIQGPETVAAVIAEPISVSNSNHVPSPGYWRRLREICDRHGVLLIMDEVITGFGRTGRMFGAEHFGVVPDLMTMAKGLSSGYAPIAAVAVSEKVFTVFKEQDAALGHLLTFGGHAVSCAAALTNIAIMECEGLVQRSAERGEYLLRQMNELRWHPTVGDVRGIGLLCCAELVQDKMSKEPFGSGATAGNHPFSRRLSELMAERGLLTRVYMAVHAAPPLVVSLAEIDRMVAIIDDSLAIAEREFGYA